MASTLDLTEANNAQITTGDDYSAVVTLRDSDGATPPVYTTPNITGRTYACQIRPTAISATIVATFTVTVTDGPGGEFTMTLANAVTALLSPMTATFDIQETTAGGTVTTVVRGVVEIVSDVTRPVVP